MKHDPFVILTPVELKLGEENKKKTVKEILARHDEYGLDCFLLAGPSKGWRSIGYPDTAHYEALARQFAAIRDAVAPHGISCGWWITLTVKSGRSPDFQPIVLSDGREAPFSSCPLDERFRERFARDAALFIRIARPDFVFTEDDFSLNATSWGGCFCPLHLKQFSERAGRRYEREEFVSLLAAGTPEAAESRRLWRELCRDSLVGFAETLRRELDKEAPQVPIGFMEPGSSVADGDSAEALSRVLAGPRHTPVCRICGTEYNGIITENLPVTLYHPLWQKERISAPFCFLHESDTYPHTRFYSSAAQMKALMSAVYSYGYDGSVFQTQQFQDDANEENAYPAMLREERARFAAISGEARRCQVAGVSLPADPEKDGGSPSDWIPTFARFGIPYTTRKAKVAFLDAQRARTVPDDKVMEQLALGLFIDAEAAKILIERGYGRYLGVSVGGGIIEGNLRFDLGITERICDGFAPDSVGHEMPGANCYASRRGNGTLSALTIADPGCEAITETYDFRGNRLGVSMTRFQNELGGRVVVYGTTVRGNGSQALWNYRRQKLFQSLLVWMGADCPMVRDEPKVWMILNVPLQPDANFFGMTTLINLGEDSLDGITLRVPDTWRKVNDILKLDSDGSWKPISFSKDDDSIRIYGELRFLEPTVLKFIG
ncbi:MAG: hypothetical protein K6G29_08360 [Clostridiales bacterium]|nr:hypothetical protein [Clostridiales bacterium]